MCNVEKRYLGFFNTLAQLHPQPFIKEYMRKHPLKGKANREDMTLWVRNLQKYSGYGSGPTLSKIKNECNKIRASKIDFSKHDHTVNKNYVKNVLRLQSY